MLQVIHPERVLYLQTKNSVDQLEWYIAWNLLITTPPNYLLGYLH